MAKKSRIPAKIRNEVFARFNCCAACGTWDAREAGHRNDGEWTQVCIQLRDALCRRAGRGHRILKAA